MSLQNPTEVEAERSRTEATTSAGPTALQFSLVLGLLVFAAFPGVLLGKATFVLRDFGLFSYPVAFFQRESFWRGELPLWNPLSLCGVPFLAQWNTLSLYPPSLIYLLLPLSWSLSFFCLAHLFWGGLGMYFLARRWTGNGLAGALAGVIFPFCGLNLNFLMWPSHVATFSWFPWVLWLVPAGWREGGNKFVWGVIAATMQMLAGGPETILFTWLVLSVLLCGEWWRQRPAQKWLVLRFCGTIMLVATICAAQLLPFIELVTHSQRDTGYGSTAWAMPIWGWANYLVPLFRTAPTQGVYFQEGQYWTSSYYVGIGTIWLMAVAIWSSRDWPVRWLAALVFLSLVLALGNSGLLYRGLRSLLPVLGFVRYPIKFVILTSALAPLLAAFGFKTLAARGKVGSSAWSFGAAILVLTAAVVLASWKLSMSSSWLAVANGAARMTFLVLILGLSVFVLAAKGRPRLVLGCGLVILFWSDCLKHVPEQNPSATSEVYAPRWAQAHLNWDPAPKPGRSRAMITPEAEQALKYRAMTNLARNYLLDRLGLLANCNLLDNVPQAHGFFSLIPEGVSDAVTAPYVLTNRDFSALLDFMGVSQMNTPGDPFKWTRRPGAMALVTMGQQPVFADDRATFAAFSQTNTDLRQIVFLPPEAQQNVSAARQASARVLSTEFTANRVRIEIDTPSPAMVVISQTYYRAWKAYVDGAKAKLWRANYGFQAVQVPAGLHHVQIVYQDGAFQAGLVLSGLGVLALVSLCLRMPWLRGPTFRHSTAGMDLAAGATAKDVLESKATSSLRPASGTANHGRRAGASSVTRLK